MKNMYLLVLSLLMVFLPIVARAADDSSLDTLPIGPSPWRLAITSLTAGEILSTRSGLPVDMSTAVRQNLGNEVFVIGEFHDSYACHAWQKEFIEALAKESPRLVVGFEFFDRADDPFLELFVSGKIGEAELLEKTGWYKRSAINFGYTRLVLETVKKLGLQAVGLNVPRELISRVGKGGFANLSAAEKSLFSGAQRSDPEHEFFIKNTLGEFAVQVPPWFQNIYAAQKCWDIVMAESMRAVLARPAFKGYKGIIIAGSAHVAYGLGIPWRYRLGNKNSKIVTLVPVLVAAKKKENESEENHMVKALAAQLKPVAVFSRGLADLVFAVAAEEKPYFAEAGFSGKMNAGGLFEVSQVRKESPAEKSGLRVGDLVLAVDGVPVKSLEGLRLVLAQKNWGDALELEVRKKITLAKDSEKLTK